MALPARLQEAAKKELPRLKREVTSTNRTLTLTDYHVIIKSKASSSNRIAGMQEHINNVNYELTVRSITRNLPVKFV